MRRNKYTIAHLGQPKVDRKIKDDRIIIGGRHVQFDDEFSMRDYPQESAFSGK